MLLAFHNAIAAGRIKGTVLDELLPRLTASLQDGFCKWVDGGAGIGSTASEYSRILDACLTDEARRQAQITCYEPLAENYGVLVQQCADADRYRLRQVALSDTNGTAQFSIPQRMEEGGGPWVAGSSYNGFVGDRGFDCEIIEVDTVRLEDDLDGVPDFVKLDLQGGELEALQGLGDMLQDVKLTYIEAQLMEAEVAAEYLFDNGFMVMYDRFQFGFNSDVANLPVRALNDMGICIDGIYSPQAGGLPLILWGHMEDGRDCFDGFRFSTETVERLKSLGVSYFQTDALGVNLRHARSILPVMHHMI